MIVFPILEKRVSLNKNQIIHRIDNKSRLIENVKLISSVPFVIEVDGNQNLITKDILDENINNFDYALISSRKPKKQDLDTGTIKLVQWAKHPGIQAKSPEEVVESWDGHFRIVKENEDKNIKGLRSPQVSALYSILAHIENPDNIGIVVMPTGTGKTETMISTLVANKCEKLLVAVPSDSLRTQLADKFAHLGLLREFKMVDENVLNPIVGILHSKPISINELSEIVENSNVVITTMNILSELGDEFRNVMTSTFTHLFVDEAHHSQAKTWNNFINSFSKNNVFLFTATPYRNDGKKLDGKFISSFSLRKAQEQKYYKQINNLPVREYDKKKADQSIADRAVKQLKEDIGNGYEHILLARCANKKRAKEVFDFYKTYEEHRPVLVHTGISGLSKKIEAIKKKEHQIIVCVDMLGEGFDLPELKIAAIHDERQSLPITLQFIGRFTRTSYEDLGNASFITNLAYPPLKQELDQLYDRDNDWNLILPILSESATQKEIDFNAFLEGFQNLGESEIPFQSINPALSAVCFKFKGDTWSPNNWRNGIAEIDSFDHQYSDYNPDQNTLVIILGKVASVDWGSFDVVKNIEWEIIVVYWDLRPNVNRIFVNTSFKSLSYQKLLGSIFDGDISIIDGMDVFKIFHDVRRLTLFNVGAKKVTGKDVSFQSFFGRDVQDGINLIEQGRLIKNNIFGVGYKHGEKISLGCSVKGKVWSYLRTNLDELTKWCRIIGDMLENPDIDPNIVLKHTLVPESISTKPEISPLTVDWCPEIYDHSENWMQIRIGEHGIYDLSSSELEIINGQDNLQFKLICEEHEIDFEYKLLEHETGDTKIAVFKIDKITDVDVRISVGRKDLTAEDFFAEYCPIIYFADGSQLHQNRYVSPRETPDSLPSENIRSIDWEGVSLNKESQNIHPYEQDSIQYHFIQHILDDFQVVYDDDGPGEIADVIGINDTSSEIELHLYHLKFAKNGRVSGDIENFYQVCGQAQKSINWKYRSGKEFFDHLLRRKIKVKNNQSCSRIIKGSEEQIEILLNAAKWTKKMKFYIYIVQPSLNKNDIPEGILALLSTTFYYLDTVGNAELVVYGSDIK